MRDAKPRLSICIPTFNAAFNLKRSVDAYLPALRQRELAFELVIVDGGSSDGTLAYVETIAAVPEIVFIPVEAHCEPRLSLILERAKGDLVLCVASDQTLFIDAVIAAVGVLERDASLGMVATPTREWSFMKAVRPKTSNDNEKDAAAHRFGRGRFRELGDFLLASGAFPEIALIRRTSLGRYGLPQTARLHESAVLLAQILERSDIVFSMEPLAEERPLIPFTPNLATSGRVHIGFPESAVAFEPYEAALEFLLSRADRSDQDKSAARTAMRTLTDARKKAVLKQLVDAKLWTDAYLLMGRLSAFGPSPISHELQQDIRIRSGTTADHLNAWGS